MAVLRRTVKAAFSLSLICILFNAQSRCPSSSQLSFCLFLNPVTKAFSPRAFSFLLFLLTPFWLQNLLLKRLRSPAASLSLLLLLPLPPPSLHGAQKVPAFVVPSCSLQPFSYFDHIGCVVTDVHLNRLNSNYYSEQL